MLKQLTATDRPRNRGNRVTRVSELEVWRTATRLEKQYPETSLLVAAHRADKAFVAGRMSNFHLWARVTHALTELCGNERAATQ